MVKKLAELDAAGKLAEYMKKPEFPGGMKAWTKAMDESISYPEIASKYQAEAKIKISFQIDKEGNMQNIEVKNYEGNRLSGAAYDKLSYQEKQDAEIAVKTAMILGDGHIVIVYDNNEVAV